MQRKGAKGLDGVVQPVAERVGSREAFFDQFPDGEFDVVLAFAERDADPDISTRTQDVEVRPLCEARIARI